MRGARLWRTRVQPSTWCTGAAPAKTTRCAASVITDCSNQSVHLIADAVGAGSLSNCTLLVNAGTKYGSMREDATIPAWALPGTPGRRGFPDKPDIVIIKNWSADQPAPTNAKRTPGYAGPAVITFLIVEHKMTNDLYLQDSRDEKRSIYVELVHELLKEGWDVELDSKVRDATTRLVRQRTPQLASHRARRRTARSTTRRA